MCQEVNDHLLSAVPPPTKPDLFDIRIKEEILDDEYLNSDDLGAYTFGELVADPTSDERIAEGQDESAPAKDDSNNNHWTCLVCRSLIPESIQLRDHLKEHYSTEVRKTDALNAPHYLTVFLSMFPQNPRCPICNKAFNSGAKVYFHFMAKHNNSNTRSSSPADTKPQVAAPSSASTRLECSLCKKKVSPPLFQHIFKDHLERGNTTCPICQKHFKATKLVHRHLIVHTGEKPFKCSLCGSFYSQTSSLYMHMRHVHKKEPTLRRTRNRFVKRPPPLADDVEPDESEEKGNETGSNEEDCKRNRENPKQRRVRFECPRCDYAGLSLYALRNHFVVHTDETPYYCSLCGTSARSRETVRRHIALHHESAADGVVKMKEGSIFELKRPWESMGFFDVENCNSLPRDYSGAKPACVSVSGEVLYQCPGCPKKLPRGKLLIHSVVHTKERPYSCQYCNTDFAQKGNVLQHIRNMHPGKDVEAGCLLKEDTLFAKQFKGIFEKKEVTAAETVQGAIDAGTVAQRYIDIFLTRSSRKLTCTQCAMKCDTSDDMKEHMKVHRFRATHPFVCEECGNSFMTEFQMESHKYVHREDRPFSCDVCGFKFKTEQYLKKHKNRAKCTIRIVPKVNPIRIVATAPGTKMAGRLRVVTKREPLTFHSCQRCDKQFRTQRGLKRHMTNHAAMDDTELSEGEVVEEREEQKPTMKKIKKLNTHVKWEESHKCPECPRRFGSSNALTKHHEWAHSKVLQVRCKRCKKGFSNLLLLSRHTKLGCTRNVYACNLCSQRSSSAVGLKEHQKRFHDK